ncbi:MAG: hypothetical protein JO097_17520 [Acidobacteriaceae bacterium]|nr:hypothetical protein [Acidobacteriaceae bacterium]MBV9296991.1 hypothetical protein [Acidobacteriaceae bacterium]MBV9765609.1 hypothetical protein [Acidobacteriaceae bacterium]
MNRFAALIALLGVPALALAQTPTVTQTPAEPATPIITKVIRVRYASPETIAELLRPGNPAVIVGDNGLKAIVLKGQSTDISSAEQAVKELDTPPPSGSGKNIEVTVYVVGATANSESRATAPREIEPVIKQLQGIFPYGSYQLLDTMQIRSGEGRQASTRGIMKSFATGSTSGSKTYSIVYNTDADSQENGQRAIRFQRFQFYTNENDKDQVGFDTDFDVREGQKVVVGKTNVNAGDSALFVVLTARILE